MRARPLQSFRLGAAPGRCWREGKGVLGSGVPVGNRDVAVVWDAASSGMKRGSPGEGGKERGCFASDL